MFVNKTYYLNLSLLKPYYNKLNSILTLLQLIIYYFNLFGDWLVFKKHLFKPVLYIKKDLTVVLKQLLLNKQQTYFILLMQSKILCLIFNDTQHVV